jgi:putative transposase
MSDYRRWYVPGGSYFLTPVTYLRHPLFATEEDVGRLRRALATVAAEMPFEIAAAVVLPDHAHFIWTLPSGDARYSKRVGRMKVEFTKQVRPAGHCASVSSRSRRRHRESDVWQRRFWEHTLDDIDDFKAHLDYIHYNPVKHGYVTCPHLWPYSSFSRWVERGVYEATWGCQCHGRQPEQFDFSSIADSVGE